MSLHFGQDATTPRLSVGQYLGQVEMQASVNAIFPRTRRMLQLFQLRSPRRVVPCLWSQVCLTSTARTSETNVGPEDLEGGLLNIRSESRVCCLRHSQHSQNY